GVLLTALGAIGAYAVARMIGQLAFRHRFWARQVTDRTLEVRFHRRVVTHGGQTYPRGPALRFTAVPHRDGRHEDRAERHAERLLTTTYREAWQVWLQHGEVFVLLADVSDEQGASAIARRLQAVDEVVSRAGQTADFSNTGRLRPH
ncbi:MAG TPA: hypothetical protein PK264_05245, partial [Hyphomicrobiaceae bacterium]|nr:hypothetical protein [Hyphomicrobiaceae bacterium]